MTTRLSLCLTPSVLAAFPETRVGAFLAQGLHSVDMRPGVVARLWDDAARAYAAAGITLDNLVERPEIKAWRDTFAMASGIKPSRYKSSPEQLARRLLKTGPVATPLAIVGAYCAVSARCLAPMGAYDVAQLKGTRIELRFGNPASDRFEPLGGRASDMPVSANVVVYANADEIICWNWNHRDSSSTSLRATTDVALFVAEAARPAQRLAAEEALLLLSSLLASSGAAVGRLMWADAGAPEVVATVRD